MSDDPPFEPPAITDEDIRWSSHLLKLPDGAFHGETGIDPRSEVLKSMEPIDVAACPGSGKTTLLVAKLAILVRKWKHPTRGICVLSHTNAARREIEKLLGNTAEGQRLLAYPHFIGTIHAFVDRFLALPMLRSLGCRSVQFSTEVAGQQLWALSGYGANLPGYLYRKITDADRRKAAVLHAHYVNEDLDIVLEAENASVKLRRGSNSGSFLDIDRWKSRVLQGGYAAYEDSLAYGHRALKMNGDLASTLRDRYPLLFIDEAQDNSEEQSKILRRIFADADAPVIRQRFGDPNQAIFRFVGDKGAVFPDGTIKNIDLPNSHRFGQKIADLADPLGISPYDLVGQGPKKPLASGKPEGVHSIFLFDRNSVGEVLGAYGNLLIETFSGQELRDGTFTAVGQVHKVKGDNHRPRHVGHYWPDYDPELTKLDPKPQGFVQYVFVGQSKAAMIGEVYPAVEKIAEGILYLAGLNEGKTPFRRGRHCHRTVLQLLENNPARQACYKILVSRFGPGRTTLTQAAWDNRWCAAVREIAEAIAGAPLPNTEADKFLAWNTEVGPNPSAPKSQTGRDNIYRYPHDDPKVHIRVGSIHSVKGETHTATLVLETFWYQHNLEKLLPWLNRSKYGAESDKKQPSDRLKLHYVAMTRPTHLLCLAMKRSTLENNDGELDPELMRSLECCGWDVRTI